MTGTPRNSPWGLIYLFCLVEGFLCRLARVLERVVHLFWKIVLLCMASLLAERRNTFYETLKPRGSFCFSSASLDILFIQSPLKLPLACQSLRLMHGPGFEMPRSTPGLSFMCWNLLFWMLLGHVFLYIVPLGPVHSGLHFLLKTNSLV